MVTVRDKIANNTNKQSECIRTHVHTHSHLHRRDRERKRDREDRKAGRQAEADRGEHAVICPGLECTRNLKQFYLNIKGDWRTQAYQGHTQPHRHNFSPIPNISELIFPPDISQTVSSLALPTPEWTESLCSSPSLASYCPSTFRRLPMACVIA